MSNRIELPEPERNLIKHIHTHASYDGSFDRKIISCDCVDVYQRLKDQGYILDERASAIPKLTSLAYAFLMQDRYDAEQEENHKRQERKEDVRYIITTAIAIAALVISLVK